MTRKMLVALVATIAIALPTAASALGTNDSVIVDGNTGAETRSMAVSLRDLNLAEQHDYRMADSRITKAAKKVCGQLNGSVVPATRDYRSCFGNALGGARENLNLLAQRS